MGFHVLVTYTLCIVFNLKLLSILSGKNITPPSAVNRAAYHFVESIVILWVGQQKLFLLFNCKLVSSDRPLPISPSHPLLSITINQHSMSKFNELTQTRLNMLSEAMLYLPLGAWFITFNIT